MRIFLGILALIVVIAIAAWAIDLDVSGDAELPTVAADVDVQGGEMPQVDAETVDVDVDADQGQIEVPDVDVNVDERTVPFPDVDVDVTAPEENTTAEENDLDGSADMGEETDMEATGAEEINR